MAVAGKAAIGITATAAAVYSLNKYFNGGQNKNFPSLQGKTIVITGGNTGLGFICAKEMVKLGPSKIVIACRDQKKANEAIQKIMEEVGEKGNLQIEYRPLDLNDLNSVKSFAETFKGDKIDILLNNAGIMAVPQKETTAQGYEKQFGVNHLGHFLLTNLLLPNMNEQARIVNVSSLSHVGAKINFEDISYEKSYTPWVAYGQSKLANIYFTKELANRLPETIKTVSLHPGVVRTELGRYMLDQSPAQKMLMNVGAPVFGIITKDPESGA